MLSHTATHPPLLFALNSFCLSVLQSFTDTKGSTSVSGDTTPCLHLSGLTDCIWFALSVVDRDHGDEEDEEQDEAEEADREWKQRQLQRSWTCSRPSYSCDTEAAECKPASAQLTSSRRSLLGFSAELQHPEKAGFSEGSSQKLAPGKSSLGEPRGRLADHANHGQQKQQQLVADPAKWNPLGSSSCSKQQQQSRHVQQAQHGWLAAGRCVVGGSSCHHQQQQQLLLHGSHSPLLGGRGGRGRARDKEAVGSPGQLLVSPPARQRSKRTGSGGSAWRRCAGLGSTEDLNDEEAAGKRSGRGLRL